jgi:hypothetical protein
MNNELTKLLDSLAAEINEATPCNADSYLYLKYLPLELKQNFTLGHSARHLAKTAGSINALFEDYEHVGKLNEEKLQEKLGSILFTTLKMIHNSGVSSEVILKHVQDYIEFEKKQNLGN